MRHPLFLLLTAALTSCSSSNTTAQRVPNDLIIRYAEGGGFTGRWTGVVIAGDGSARSWSPSERDSMSTTLGRIPASTMEALWHTIEREGLLNGTGGGAPGNMTRTIALSIGGKSVEVRWPYGATVDARTQPYTALYEQCRKAVEALKR
ncbi:MAG: hypothetical protein MUE68_08755 [Bacteroidetes bacterium]|nr:hypothetical protein [Bacteroidota bacterium]